MARPSRACSRDCGRRTLTRGSVGEHSELRVHLVKLVSEVFRRPNHGLVFAQLGQRRQCLVEKVSAHRGKGFHWCRAVHCCPAKREVLLAQPLNDAKLGGSAFIPISLISLQLSKPPRRAPGWSTTPTGSHFRFDWAHSRQGGIGMPIVLRAASVPQPIPPIGLGSGKTRGKGDLGCEICRVTGAGWPDGGRATP